MNHKRKFWVGFNLVKGVGPRRLEALLKHFGDIEAAWNGRATDFAAAGLSQKLARKIIRARRQVDLDQIWQTILSSEIEVITWEDRRYPKRLRETDSPPPLLYVRGALQEADEWAVAVVGTRRISAYGRQVAEKIVRYLARNRISVVSGLARGVDTVAHRTALEMGGRTLAVLGCGVDRVYPPENRLLARQILEHGALISDYPVGTPPEAGNFPPRNRIISGLSLAVVIVEAGEKSGALITAGFAAEQGREVFAVPGSIFGPQSMGTNDLIRKGAVPLLDPDDILETLNMQLIHHFQAANRVLPGNVTERALYDQLGHEPAHVDELCRAVGGSIEEIVAALTMMELKGLVRQVGGMNYVLLR
jgi:DNA processing protein